MYTKEFVKEMENLLLNKKARLEDELSRIAEKNNTVKDDYKTKFNEYGDQLEDNAMEITDYANNLPIEQHLELNLKAVNKALLRIENGIYGKCENCGEMISEQRLKAVPEAISCMKCNKNK